jgi:A/G-specific adenine glycosylase
MTRHGSRKRSKNEIDTSWLTAVRGKVLRWGRRNFAAYPWRYDRDPWLTLIAELLLQRTRASQVLQAYELLRSRYRTPSDLLRSGRRGVRALTNRVGLHTRGETLLEIARLFDRQEIPTRAEELRAINGVGAYTAAAWLSLHRGRRAVIIDSNIFRWLGRMTAQPYQRDPRHIRWVNDLAEALTPRRSFRDYNYAVLDFTMTICTPRQPDCPRCPLRLLCAYGMRNESERQETRHEP